MPTAKSVGDPGAREPHARFELAAGGIRHQLATATRRPRLPPTLQSKRAQLGGGLRVLDECAIGNEPDVFLSRDGCDSIVIPVVVDERHVRELRRGGYQEIRRRNPAMVTGGGHRELDFLCSAPQRLRHSERVERSQTGRELTGSLLIRR
jgi:hypothetical protein